MSLFQKIADRLYASVEKEIGRPTPVTNNDYYDKMVGEPVISFLKSLKNEPHRYRCRMIEMNKFSGQLYFWMSEGDGFYQMTDRKTGQKYEAFIHDGRISQLISLPAIGFDFNGWEHQAIFKAFVERYEAVSVRRAKSRNKRIARQRELDEAHKKKLRLEFAKQFQ